MTSNNNPIPEQIEEWHEMADDGGFERRETVVEETVEDIFEEEFGEDFYDEDEDDCEPEHDGQPTEYEEWQDFMGGDDWDHGQYDHDEY